MRSFFEGRRLKASTSTPSSTGPFLSPASRRYPVVPRQLTSTVDLLRRAFPSGKLDNDEYDAVLEILFPHLADENLVIVMVDVTGRDAGVILNDVYRAGSVGRTPSVVRERVMKLLDRAGFDEWLSPPE
jgi:hypothetical protein